MGFKITSQEFATLGVGLDRIAIIPVPADDISAATGIAIKTENLSEMDVGKVIAMNDTAVENVGDRISVGDFIVYNRMSGAERMEFIVDGVPVTVRTIFWQDIPVHLSIKPGESK